MTKWNSWKFQDKFTLLRHNEEVTIRIAKASLFHVLITSINVNSESLLCIWTTYRVWSIHSLPWRLMPFNIMDNYSNNSHSRGIKEDVLFFKLIDLDIETTVCLSKFRFHKNLWHRDLATKEPLQKNPLWKRDNAPWSMISHVQHPYLICLFWSFLNAWKRLQ